MDRNEETQRARAVVEEIYRTDQSLRLEAVLLIVNEYLGKPVFDEVVKLASRFQVRMGLAGCACGAINGGVLSLGLKYGRTQAGAPMPGSSKPRKNCMPVFRHAGKVLVAGF